MFLSLNHLRRSPLFEFSVANDFEIVSSNGDKVHSISDIPKSLSSHQRFQSRNTELLDGSPNSCKNVHERPMFLSSELESENYICFMIYKKNSFEKIVLSVDQYPIKFQYRFTLLTILEVPNSDGFVVGGAQQVFSAWMKLQTANPIVMAR